MAANTSPTAKSLKRRLDGVMHLTADLLALGNLQGGLTRGETTRSLGLYFNVTPAALIYKSQ